MFSIWMIRKSATALHRQAISWDRALYMCVRVCVEWLDAQTSKCIRGSGTSARGLLLVRRHLVRTIKSWLDCQRSWVQLHLANRERGRGGGRRDAVTAFA